MIVHWSFLEVYYSHFGRTRSSQCTSVHQRSCALCCRVQCSRSDLHRVPRTLEISYRGPAPRRRSTGHIVHSVRDRCSSGQRSHQSVLQAIWSRGHWCPPESLQTTRWGADENIPGMRVPLSVDKSIHFTFVRPTMEAKPPPNHRAILFIGWIVWHLFSGTSTWAWASPSSTRAWQSSASFGQVSQWRWTNSRQTVESWKGVVGACVSRSGSSVITQLLCSISLLLRYFNW